MPLKARRLIRKMRGGAQAHLLEVEDGSYYVVKFQENPQHRRILVNELVAAELLRYLQIPAPVASIIELTSEFLRETPELYIQLGTRNSPVQAGWHFGSKHPGDPARMAIYDFVPDALLEKIQNLHDFLAVLVFDKWTANADGRQSIFFRAQIKDWLASPRKLGFVALMVDHGFCFNGPHWDFPNSPAQGLYMRRRVYQSVQSLDDFQPWLAQVENFPEQVIDKALRAIPPQWLADDGDLLEQLLEKLMRRRKLVPDLLREVQRAKVNPFPNWT